MFDGLVLLLLIVIGGVFCPYFYMLEQFYFFAVSVIIAIALFFIMMNSDKIIKPQITISVQRVTKIGRIEFSEPTNVQVTRTEHPWRLQDARTEYYVDLSKQSWVDLVPGERERLEENATLGDSKLS
jgi:hypothetical protein